MRRSLLSKCLMVARYRRKCDFIYAPSKTKEKPSLGRFSRNSQILNSITCLYEISAKFDNIRGKVTVQTFDPNLSMAFTVTIFMEHTIHCDDFHENKFTETIFTRTHNSLRQFSRVHTIHSTIFTKTQFTAMIFTKTHFIATIFTKTQLTATIFTKTHNSLLQLSREHTISATIFTRTNSLRQLSRGQKIHCDDFHETQFTATAFTKHTIHRNDFHETQFSVTIFKKHNKL